MAYNQIRIEKIRLKQLNDFAADVVNTSAFEKTAPITPARALSQTKNPNAHPDDVVLLVAYQGNQCVGYHGLLPGMLEQNGQLSKVFWATAFFVSPELRGSGIGKRLLSEIIKLNVDFVVTGMTHGAKETYKSMGFKPLGSVTYYQLRTERVHLFEPFFRAVYSIPERPDQKSGKRLATVERLDAELYRLTKAVFFKTALRFWPEGKTCAGVLEADQLKFRHEAALRSPSTCPGRPAFYRGIDAVNWMIRYRWVVAPDELQAGIGHYHFSKSRDIFKYIALEIPSSHGSPSKGFLVLSVSRNKSKTAVKLLDFHFQDPKDRWCAAFLGLRYGAEYLADRIDIPSALAACFKNNRLLKPLLKRQTRLFMFYPKSIDSPLALSKENIALNYCDGDTAFT
ncbi:MAG: GNAT family N-acetyltransferase [Pseudomonadota bacterium]